jgi:glycogen debranching enzyme
VRWTDDYTTIRKLWPHLVRAMAWCREKIRTGVDGFIAYSRASARGLENQGWKDSHDSMVWPDGKLVQPPIALIEVQAYMAAAFAAYAYIADALGDPSGKDAARDGPLFCKRIDEAFGHEELGYVMCLDAAGQQVPTAASNAGHMLWSGIARRDLAKLSANRLMEPDMFSGWGVRTLSSMVSGYNPLGYHVGSVWPHDNAMLLGGMRWFGFDEQAEVLGSSLIEMSLAFPEYRVPELFSGDARELRQVPTPYPVASRPQAWSAASLPYVFASLLGLRPGIPGQIAVVRPRLPVGVQWARVRNLRFGNGALDLTFRRQRKHVSVEVEQIHGHVEVVLSEVFPGARAIADSDT